LNDKLFSPGLHKLIHHQEHLMKLERREPVSPIHLSVFPTNKCQLKCEYCCFKNQERSDEELSFEDFRKSVNVLTKYGLKALELSGGGDPLLWNCFEEAVSYAHYNGLKLSLVTNGLELSNISIPVLEKFSWIRVSIQSVKYAENIDFKRIPCNVRKSMSYIVYNKESLDRLDDLYNYSKDNNIVIRVASRRPSKVKWEEMIPTKLKRLENNGYPLVTFDKEYGSPKGCYMTWIRAAIDWRGNFLPCPSIELSYESEGKIDESFAICKINDLEEWIKNNPIHDMGYRCTFCNCGKETNDFIHSLLSDVEDKDFV